MVLTAGQFLFGVLVQDHVLFGRFVDPYGDHCQALGVLLLALARLVVFVLLGSFGMPLSDPVYALVHVFPPLLDQKKRHRRAGCSLAGATRRTVVLARLLDDQGKSMGDSGYVDLRSDTVTRPSPA